MKFEITFDFIDDVVDENGDIVARVLRNDFTFIEADNMEQAQISFYKYVNGMIKTIKEVKR